MTRRISLVFVLILALVLCIAVGCKYLPKTEDNNKENSDEIIIEEVVVETHKTEADEQISTIEKLPESETLSAEDKAVKTEISKHIDTAVDFRYNKQEVLQDKTFDITFSEIDQSSNYERVIYKNELGDEFAYNTNNGKLRYAVIESVAVKKTAESIDCETAQQIATEYISANCDISRYIMSQQKEIDTGYYFCYTRYIGSYPSVDRFSVQIGYDGNIVYISDFTDTFTGKELNLDEIFIDAKIRECLDETKVDWDSITICLNEGKLAVRYIIPEQHAVAVLPLE